MYYFLRILSYIISSLSLNASRNAGKFIGRFFHRFYTYRKDEALKNIKKAMPEYSNKNTDKLIPKLYEHFGITFIEALRHNSMNFDRELTVENLSILDDTLALRKGVILLSGHFGNWELIPVWLAKKGYPLYCIIQRLKNKGANKFLFEHRSFTGAALLYRNTPFNELENVLEKGKILALASDQDFRKKGVFLDFFNIPSSTPKGAAVFHLKTGAPMIFTICYLNTNGKWHLKFDTIPTYKNDKVETIMQRYNHILENEIRKRPEQYFWFHRRWKTKPN